MRRSVLFLIILQSACAFAQDIKPLDYAAVFKRHHVRVQTCHEIRYKNSTPDTLLLGQAEFDREGRMTVYTEYFAGGRIYAIYSYEYSKEGKMSLASVQHVFNEMKPIPMNISFNEKGKIIALELTEPIRNFWVKQTFTYNSKNVLIRSDQWFDRDGTLKPLNGKDYPSTVSTRENSLTYIHDEKGLEILHQFYSSPGKIERSWKYSYGFY